MEIGTGIERIIRRSRRGDCRRTGRLLHRLRNLGLDNFSSDPERNDGVKADFRHGEPSRRDGAFMDDG